MSLLCLHANAEEKVIRLYDGPAPGSENWKHNEKENRTNLWQTRVVFNVANPTLTVFPPEAAAANGTAVVICPAARSSHCPSTAKVSMSPAGSTQRASPVSF